MIISAKWIILFLILVIGIFIAFKVEASNAVKALVITLLAVIAILVFLLMF